MNSQTVLFWTSKVFTNLECGITKVTVHKPTTSFNTLLVLASLLVCTVHHNVCCTFFGFARFSFSFLVWAYNERNFTVLYQSENTLRKDWENIQLNLAHDASTIAWLWYEWNLHCQYSYYNVYILKLAVTSVPSCRYCACVPLHLPWASAFMLSVIKFKARFFLYHCQLQIQPTVFCL